MMPPVRRTRPWRLWLACLLALSMAACAPAETPAPTTVSPTPSHPRAQVTPAPTLTNAPAALYGNVLTDQRVVSLVLEGFTDERSMAAIIQLLKAARVPAVFFISGVVADEQPGTVQAIAKAGFPIGNYGLNALKKMQDRDVYANLHQFNRTQELIRAAAGVTPVLFRCNGSVYTRELLQAGAAAGLSAAVAPNAFLNHTSFDDAQDAQIYVRRLARGSIISIKLGQVLDSEEYGGLTYTMDNRAIDPPPFLSDRMEDSIEEVYANIPRVVEWLLAALEAEGYAVLTPEQLQAERITMFDNPAPLDAQTLALLDTEGKTLPITTAALDYLLPTPDPTPSASTPEATPAPAGSDATALPVPGGLLLIGDSLTGGLSSYVAWRRESDPGFMPKLTFLTADAFSLGDSLQAEPSAKAQLVFGGVPVSVAEGALAMDARTVLLMPGQADVRAYTLTRFLDHLKLTLYTLRTTLPQAEIWLQSIPPGVAGRTTQPDNWRIFTYNLAMYRLCREFSIPFFDVAYRLRGTDGNLPPALCLDPDTNGFHLSDAACDRWLAALRQHLP